MEESRVPCLLTESCGRDAVRQGIPYVVQIQACIIAGFLVYGNRLVIESLTDKTRYTGTALDAQNRLAEHNARKNRCTKGPPPFIHY
jgi:hypothetical protein